jgi:peroxiredoxin
VAGGGALWLRGPTTGTLIARELEFILFVGDSRTASARSFEVRGGRLPLPPGQYRLTGWRVRMRDTHGRAWEIASAPGEPARTVAVRSGHITWLPLAAPVEPALVVEQSGADVSFRLRLKGAGGETVGEVQVNGRPASPPALRIEDARGRVVGRVRFEDTCGAGCAQLWRPPPGLRQPLSAIPEVDLGPFRLTPAAFRFRLNAPSAPKVAIGRSAPDFCLFPAGGGRPVRLASFRGRPVTLGFFCGCGLCQGAARRLAPELAARRVPLLVIVENPRQLRPEAVARFGEVTGFHGPVLADPDGRVTRRYLGLACPRLWIIDARGTAIYTNTDPRTPPAALARAITQTLQAARG